MFEKDKPDFSIDDSWLPIRPLGAGSFGAVGLFEHHDEGEVDDHKEDSIRENIPGISAEAAIMMQLNEIPNSEGVLYLRNFRHYGDMQVCLHLLEYCPNLNLEALRLTYRAMKRTLPESFLWYVFYTLAKGLAAVETGPFGEDLDPSKIRPRSYLLHRDMTSRATSHPL
jgi:serine/threonine protein kinase